MPAGSGSFILIAQAHLQGGKAGFFPCSACCRAEEAARGRGRIWLQVAHESVRPWLHVELFWETNRRRIAPLLVSKKSQQ